MTITVVAGPVIAAGQSLSGTLDPLAKTLRGIIFPAAWSHAAPLTFQASHNGTSFFDVYRPPGPVLQLTVTPGGMIVLEMDIWQRFTFKFRSGTPNAPAVQHQVRTFTCLFE
jgi:hypothetical protein